MPVLKLSENLQNNKETGMTQSSTTNLKELQLQKKIVLLNLNYLDATHLLILGKPYFESCRVLRKSMLRNYATTIKRMLANKHGHLL